MQANVYIYNRNPEVNRMQIIIFHKHDSHTDMKAAEVPEGLALVLMQFDDPLRFNDLQRRCQLSCELN